jgi:flavin-dependent dehydrogenase
MQYDCAIIGGGLAGLSLSILLAEKGWRIVLFEKNEYPFHRVCGEYISLESRPFLERLGLRISGEQFPHISQLQVSSVKGTTINRPLDLGGFGISRYLLDYELSKLAKSKGVTIVHTRVEDVPQETDHFLVKTKQGNYTARICNGSFGKRSNLDIKWKRPFVQSKSKGLNNFLGIKYHIKYPHPKELIALHNFKNGYCGISAIEDDKYCFCYLTRASNLAESYNDIATMEKNILQQNPFLEDIFSRAEFLYPEPLVISQVSFSQKEQVIHQFPLTGDAAGLITPLCGNGMSMAMHASHMLAPLIDKYLRNNLGISMLNDLYKSLWQKEFKRRLQTGRMVQQLFGNNQLTEMLLQTCKLFPRIADTLIRSTHGQPF